MIKAEKIQPQLKYNKMNISELQKEEKHLSERIEELADYIKKNKEEDENILQMQLFQMMQYKDSLKQRIDKLSK